MDAAKMLEAVCKDAMRFRYLRDHASRAEQDTLLSMHKGAELDAAIDCRIADYEANTGTFWSPAEEQHG